MEYKVGELSDWNEANVGSNDFMNLTEGDNTIRIFTKPYQFYCAWVLDASGTNRKVKSAIKNCPLVKGQFKLQPRWMLGAIDRKSGLPKILEISTQIYNNIKEYNNDEAWGDVTEYDLNIKRGAKNSQPLYRVIARPKKPLTTEEKELIKQFKERVDINKFTTPPSPEQVAEQLEVMGVTGPSPAPKTSNGQQRPKKAEVKPTLSDEDFDFGDDEEL